jgi:hypothetical protein
VTAPASTPAPRYAAFEVGDWLNISISNVEGYDGVTDTRTGIIHISPEAALDVERAAAVLVDGWRALTEHRRPKLRAIEGGGRQTTRRGSLRVVRDAR